MHVKGTLIEGRDGREYLLGFGRQPTGQLSQLGSRSAHVIGPGWGRELFLWSAFADALKSLPALPTWPKWSPPE